MYGGPCFHGTACPKAADRGYGLQKWWVAANMLNKQPWTANRGGPPAWELVEGLTAPHRKKETVKNPLDLGRYLELREMKLQENGESYTMLTYRHCILCLMLLGILN